MIFMLRDCSLRIEIMLFLSVNIYFNFKKVTIIMIINNSI